MSYWQDRMVRTQTAIADKTIDDIELRLKKYYTSAMTNIISEFESTYEKLMNTVEDGKQPTPADLYKLEKYWKMQGHLKDEAQKLGDKIIALLSKNFEKEWKEVYESIKIPSVESEAFNTMSIKNANAMINTSWLADGKTFSQRVWGNTEKLVETLNSNLIHCVITGQKTTKLKQLLQERFNVSYNRADTLVRTEVAHIQTKAAAERYQDYGLTKYKFLGREEHDIGCDCKKLDGKIFLYSEMVTGKNAPPLHPNCRCTIVPVIDKKREKIRKENVGPKKEN